MSNGVGSGMSNRAGMGIHNPHGYGYGYTIYTYSGYEGGMGTKILMGTYMEVPFSVPILPDCHLY